MARPKRQAVHLRAAAQRKKQRQNEKISSDSSTSDDKLPLWHVHWDGLADDDSDEEERRYEEELDLANLEPTTQDVNENASSDIKERLMGPKAWDNIRGPKTISGSRQEGPNPSQSTIERHRRHAREMAKAAETIQPLSKWFGSQAPVKKDDMNVNAKRERAVEDMNKVLKSKNNGLLGSDLKRHQIVLELMNATLTNKRRRSREDIAVGIAEGYQRGPYLAEIMIRWERSWVETRTISSDGRGRKSALRNWLNDEGTLLAVRDYISKANHSKLNTTKNPLYVRLVLTNIQQK